MLIHEFIGASKVRLWQLDGIHNFPTNEDGPFSQEFSIHSSQNSNKIIPHNGHIDFSKIYTLNLTNFIFTFNFKWKISYYPWWFHSSPWIGSNQLSSLPQFHSLWHGVQYIPHGKHIWQIISFTLEQIYIGIKVENSNDQYQRGTHQF